MALYYLVTTVSTTVHRVLADDEDHATERMFEGEGELLASDSDVVNVSLDADHPEGKN